MTAVYLAYSISGNCMAAFEKLDWEKHPIKLLVSFFYLEQYRRMDPVPRPPRTILDSGAFTAWKSKRDIDIHALTRETITGPWDECVALDVIGDGIGSLTNALHMKAEGSPAYPVFHIGEDWDLLTVYRNEFPKVGLSCRFGEPIKESLRFLDGCFARAWPYKFHSFGWVAEDMLLKYPFHSADTASWNNGPAIWGRWKAFPGMKGGLGVLPLIPEIERYLELERKLQFRWSKEMRLLEALTVA